MKKPALALALVALSVAGCVTRTETGQRITIVSPAPHSTLPKVELSKNPYTSVPEEIAIRSLSEFDLKILAALRELETKDSQARDWWFLERNGNFTLSGSLFPNGAEASSVSFRVNWPSRTIDLIGAGGSGQKTSMAQMVEKHLRTRLPQARISRADYQLTHYQKFDVSP